MKSRWFLPSTIPLMLVMLLPVTAANVFLIVGAPINYDIVVPVPSIAKVMIVVAYVDQIVIAYFASLLFEWTLVAAGKRHLLQLRLSSCIAYMLVASALVLWTVRANQNFLEFNHYSTIAILWTSIVAISVAAAPLAFILGVIFILAVDDLATGLFAEKAAIRSNNVTYPTDPTLKPLYPTVSERNLGAIPLILLICVIFGSLGVLDNTLPLWRSFRLDLPFFSQCARAWHNLATQYTFVPVVVALASMVAYWKWISTDRTRIFWFNVVVIAILLFGILILALGAALPFLTRSCIAEGSEIETPDGKKRIEDLNVGDTILGRSTDGETQPAKVTHIRRGVSKSLINMKLDGGLALRVTAEHPLALKERWARASDLRVGDVVICREGTRAIVELETIHESATVYDITVEPCHTFFANGILVHNALKKK